MNSAPVSRRLAYAFYMAVFVTAVTLTVAAASGSPGVRLIFLPEWTVTFVVLLLGAYIAGRIPYLVLRALVVMVAGVGASIYVALMPFGTYFPSVENYLMLLARTWFFVVAGGVEVLFLALVAELLLKLVLRPRSRKGNEKPLPN